MDKNKIIQAATKYVQRGQLDKAIAEYNKARRADPKDVRILLKIGELQQRKGDKAQAADTLHEVAKSYAEDGFFLKAVAVYKQIVKLDPSRVHVNVQLAELYQQLGLNSDAMSQLEVVANHYEREGNAAEALSTLRRMVDLDPDNVTSRIKLGELFAQQGQTGDALRELRISAEHLKSYNRMDDYLRVAERIALLDPEDVALSLELAESFLDRRDARRALARLQVCFNANPRDPKTLELLARAFRELGQVPKAVAVYKEMARIHREAGQPELEREAWRKALSLAPDDPEALSFSRGPQAPAASPASRVTTGEIERPARPPVITAPEIPAPAPAAAPPPAARGQAKAPAASGAEQLPKLLTEVDVYIKYGLFEKASAHLDLVRGMAPDDLGVLERQVQLHLAQEDRNAAQSAMIALVQACLDQGERERGQPFLHTLIDEASEHPEVQRLLAAYSAPPPAEPEAPPAEASVVLEIDELEPAEDAAEEAAAPAPISAEELAALGGSEETAGPSFLDLPEGDEELFQPPAEAAEDEDLLLLPDPEGAEAVLVDDLVGEEWGLDEAVVAGEPSAAEEDGAGLLSETGELDDDAIFRSLPPVDDESLARPEELALDAQLLGKVGDAAKEDPFALGDDPLLVGDEVEEDEAEVFSVGTSVESSFGPEEGPVLGEATGAWEEAQAVEGVTAEAAPEGDQAEASGPAAQEIGGRSEIEVELLEGRFLLDNDYLAEAEEKFRAVLRLDPAHEEALRLLKEAEDRSARRGKDADPEPIDLDRTVVRLPTPEELAGLEGGADEQPTVVAMPLDAAALTADEREPGEEAAQPALDEAELEVAALEAAAAEAEAILEASRPLVEPEPVEPEGGTFDLSAELAHELGALEPEPSPVQQFQYSVDDVLAEFKKGVSQTVSAEDSETHYDLGIAYKEMGLLHDAIAEFEIARQGSAGQRKEIDCLTMAGMCEALLGDHEAAIARFLQALGLPAVTPEAAMALHFEIGLSYEAVGNHEEALSHFGKVARIDPSYRDVEETIRRLEASASPSQPSRQQEGMG